MDFVVLRTGPDYHNIQIFKACTLQWGYAATSLMWATEGKESGNMNLNVSLVDYCGEPQEAV